MYMYIYYTARANVIRNANKMERDIESCLQNKNIFWGNCCVLFM